jgi:hypothetical protein
LFDVEQAQRRKVGLKIREANRSSFRSFSGGVGIEDQGAQSASPIDVLGKSSYH